MVSQTLMLTTPAGRAWDVKQSENFEDMNQSIGLSLLFRLYIITLPQNSICSWCACMC